MAERADLMKGVPSAGQMKGVPSIYTSALQTDDLRRTAARDWLARHDDMIRTTDYHIAEARRDGDTVRVDEWLDLRADWVNLKALSEQTLKELGDTRQT